MNQRLLTPNPEDWLSGQAAAELVGVSYQTFHRWTNGDNPLITRYTVTGSARPMFWRAEVERFRDARRLTTGAGAHADR